MRQSQDSDTEDLLSDDNILSVIREKTVLDLPLFPPQVQRLVQGVRRRARRLIIRGEPISDQTIIRAITKAKPRHVRYGRTHRGRPGIAGKIARSRRER